MSSPADPPPPATSLTSLSVGDLVESRYRIDAVLGEGGMGVVYRAEHLLLRKPHALKVLLPQWSQMPELLARFEREAVAAGNIQSPHVAAATDFGRLPNGSFFLVMEYLDGRTLRDALQEGAMAPARALHILRGVVAALEAAHVLGIVHRDIKPENIMLVERGADADFVKVLDFGIARVANVEAAGPGSSSSPLTQVGAVIGTPDYMAPEQALGQSVDARSDLYSVGVVLYEMLTGSCPFAGGALTVIRQHIVAEAPPLPPAVAASADPRIGSILGRLLAKQPESRFASATELLAALDQLSQTPRPPETARAPAPSPASHARADLVKATTAALRTMPGRLDALARAVLTEPRAVLDARHRVAAIVVASAAALTMLVAVLLFASFLRAADDTTDTTDTTAAVDAGPLRLDIPPSEPAPLPAASNEPPTEPAAPSAQPPTRGRGRRRRIPPPNQWFR